MATVTPYKRELPFIHRAWKTAFQYAGRKLTTVNGDSPVNGDEALRGAKRRRLGDDSFESALNGSLGHLLPESTDDFEKVFRVEVLKIIQNGSPTFQAETLLNGAKSPAKKDIPNIRIRCRLTIYWFKNRGNGKEYRALYSDNQICTIKVFRDGDGAAPMARIYLASPFQIPADKIYVERDDDTKGFGLDDEYMIGVELESAGDPRWPPLDLLPKADTRDAAPDRRRHWVLSTQFKYRFDKHRWTSPVKLRKRPGEDLPTEFRMDIDLRWSAGHAMGTKARIGQEPSPPDVKASSVDGALEPLTNGHVNGRVENLTNGHVKDAPHDIVIDEDEEPEEATTPSRSLRHREKQNYNLKLLSDKARGKERKERKRRKAAADAEAKLGQVTWVLPRTGKVVVDKFACLRCFAEHSSMDELREHLECHTDYKHSYPSNGNVVVITPHGQATPRISKSYLLEPHGMDEHESDIEEQPSPPKARRSYSRSKNSQHPALPTKPKDTKQVIPNNKQPIYDPLSKQLLEPGSRVDPPGVDMSWLLQKHRDIIRDYSDLHQDEKEFLTEWDAFVIREGVTTEPHLQEVYLDFVQKKASWMLAYQSRMTEFAKHLSYLAARKALTEETIARALDVLRQAKSQKRMEQPERPKTPSPRSETRKSASGCAVCGQPVRGPSTLICANLECTRSFYHDDCIRGDAAMPVEARNWRCNNCYVKEETAAEAGPASQLN
ncbi:hypothetical protein DL767_008389 [Monosporascus sp. MG133]|nr:hypothetical protein DL767_008389 [Monosporascus sp. MG133]